MTTSQNVTAPKLEVPRALLDEYAAQLNALSKASQQLVLNALENAEWDTVAQLREIMAVVMDQVCFDAVDAARIVAADMYDDVRKAAVGKKLGYMPQLHYDPNKVYGAVKACIQSVVKTGDTRQFGQKLADRVDYEIKNSAAASAAQFARMDPLKPRWARVPTGRETCAKCIMLASRGFVYHSAEAASHFHQHCDCRVVQGYDGMAVEGYDPDALYRVWKRLEGAEVVAKDLYAGGPVSIRRQADGLDRALAKEWAAHKAIDSSAKAYQDTYGRFVESQSAGGRISIEDFTRIEGKELQLATWLSGIDWDVAFRNPNDATRAGASTSDFLVNGLLYEAKRISSSNPKKIGTRINEKLGLQGPRFIVDLSCSEMTREEAEAKIAWLLEDERIEEMLLVKSKTGLRLKKCAPIESRSRGQTPQTTASS